jgi:hypothetical protein
VSHGSLVYGFGGIHVKVVEHPVIVKRSHLVQWKQKVFNVSQKKLATLRALHGWTVDQMANHFSVSRITIKRRLYDLDRYDRKKK